MKATYEVELTFSGKLNAKQKNAIVKNIFNALINECNTRGIVPDDAEHFTETISVIRKESNWSITGDVIDGEKI